jgi:peptidoglycan/xylan/chitin deacetylase (PgdA/CDA1 family)
MVCSNTSGARSPVHRRLIQEAQMSSRISLARARTDAAAPPVPVLLYHSITADPPDWIAPLTVSPKVFAEHLDAVRDSGRQPLTVSEYMDAVLGNAVMPTDPVVITVDDGFSDFRHNALPALSERGLPSTLYVTTGSLADRPAESVLPPAEMLRLSELAELESAGVEIGAHSHSHRQMDLLSAGAAEREIVLSRTILADALGHPIRSFAYPHGYWRRTVRRLVGEAGFDSCCAVGQSLSPAGEHPLAISRLMIHAHHDAAAVAGWLRPDGARVISGRHRVLSFGWRQYRRAQQLRHPETQSF